MNCIEDAKRDLLAFNINVTSFATFRYEENYNMSTIIQCPQYEKRIVTSRVYYRLVLPLNGKQLRFVNITCSSTPDRDFPSQRIQDFTASLFHLFPR